MKPSHYVYHLILITYLLIFSWAPQSNATSAICSHEKINELLTDPALDGKTSVVVDCSINLKPTDKVLKQIIFEGAAASTATLDCNQASIISPIGIDSILIRSTHAPLVGADDIPNFSRPTGVKVTHCRIQGSIRIYGMDPNSGGEITRRSSRKDNKHTIRAQDAAPQYIKIIENTITGKGRTPLYLSSGVSNSQVVKNNFEGHAYGVALYLDSESTSNHIGGNSFNVDILNTYREIIAVDGSANNLITHNTFLKQSYGAINIYRNCGESGVVRHQKPENNQIIENMFHQDRQVSITIGSRNGDRSYCDDDMGLNFGTSLFNFDSANSTIISGNSFKVNESGQDFTSRYVIQTRSTLPSQILCNKVISYSKSDLGSGIFANRIFGNFTDGGSNTVSQIEKLPVRVPFSCQTLGSNNGCNKEVLCPSGKTIRSITAVCNLEYGTLAPSNLTAIAEGSLNVQKASAYQNDGSCGIDELQISIAGALTSQLVGRSKVTVNCRERDRNGGDCHILGEMWCK